MAKRSDFAQKLLDDLRVRKERMTASHHHQNSRGSRPVASDSYTYTKPTNRSSREMRTQQTAGIRTATGHNRHTSSNRSVSMDNNSKQLVPVRRGQQQNHQVGDLTMALTFAIENGAKLGTMDAPGSRSMLNFLHQISRRSVDWGNIQKASNIDIHFSTSSHLPALSNHHIREISKGAQRLNQILRACSNGHNFDTYSVEIGKELLKGAMDLQESLRMLVNLQEGSDYTVTPQRKGRIKLLDEEGEEEDDEDDKSMKGAIQMNQVALPRFSFDRGPSRAPSSHSKEVTRTDLKQRMALPFSPEDPGKVSGVSNSSFPSHKRSSSRVSSVRNPTVPETRNKPSASKPIQEKKRISNVVAKLMGLEERPANEDVVDGTMEKEASSRKKMAGSVVISPDKGNENRRNTKDVENLVPPPGRKQKQVMQEETYALQSEQHDGRKIHKDVEGIKPMRGSNMANMKIDKQQSNNISSQLNRSVKEIGEKEWKHTNAEVKRGQKVDDFEDMIPLHDQYQMVLVPHPVIGSESAITWPGQTELMADNRGASKQISSNRVKEYQNQQHPSLAQNFDSKDMKQQKTRTKRQEPVQRNQATRQGKSHIESEDATNSKRVVLNTSNEDLGPARSPATAIVHKQDSRSRNLNENLPSKVLKSDNTTKTKKRIPFSGSGKEEKPVRLPATEKVKTTATRAQKVETAQKIDELAEKRRRASQKLPNTPRMKHQASPTFPQKKQRGVDKKLIASKETSKERSGKFKEPKVQLVKSKKPVTSIQTETGEALKFELHDNLSDDGASLKGPEVPASSENIVATEMANQEDQEPNNGGSEEHESQTTISDSVKGTHEDRPEMDHINQQRVQEDQKLTQQKQLPKPLTEAENHLKQILVKNQRFLDTAEALFRLDIPNEILNVSGTPDLHNQESKLTADCGYEVMKRKGKRQELLRTHRFTRLTVNSTARKSLDDLIRQLCNDLEKLRFYGRNGNSKSGIEDYLPKMLEADVCSSEPDVNSMWEIGWERPDLKFPQQEEVIREVEKHVLNVLLDEVAGDFLALAVF